MIINKYGPENVYAVHVPEYAGSSNDVVFKDLPVSIATFKECIDFELPPDKWFALDNGTIVRFPKSKEWAWRTSRSEKIVQTISEIQDPMDRIYALRNAAYLCGFSLEDLVSRLQSSSVKGEDILDTFKRLVKDFPTLKNP